jgi:serine/threonine protein kinase
VQFVPRKLSKADLEEVSLLSRLDHRNIVQLIGVGVCETATSVEIVTLTEYCHTDLFKLLRSRAAPEFNSILILMGQISDGINYLHDREATSSRHGR